VIVFGWGKKAKRLANAGMSKCPNCHNWTAFGVFSRASAVSLYFVPVAKFGTKFYLVCSTCDAGFEINDAKKTELLRASCDLPTTEHMISIWNALDDAALKLSQWSPSQGAPCPSLLEATEALKSTYSAADVDYVARMFAASLADVDEQSTGSNQ